MAKSCKGLAMELVKCLSETNCVKVEKRSYRECAGEKSPNINTECVGLRETYFNCKRGQVGLLQSVGLGKLLLKSRYFDKIGAKVGLLSLDMRARIRGNKGY